MENEGCYKNMIKYLELYKPESTLKQLKLKGAHLDRYTKSKILTKNAALELTASILEILCMPFQLGGLTISFDGIRDKKTNLYSF